MIPETLAELAVPIGSLRPYGRNPRRGDVAAIRRSLEVNGQYRPLVVNRRSGEVLAGNHTLAAALELGWQEIAVTHVDVDDDQAARIVLADNRTNDLAGYDDGELAALLLSLEELDGTAWDLDELERLLQSGDTGRDTEPGELPTKPVCQPGEIWRLGEHRLLCGDATVLAQVETLADGGRVAAVWTDPPYGVDYEGKTKEALTFANDVAQGLRALLRGAFAAADKVMTPGARFYVAAPAGPRGTDFRLALDEVGWVFHQALVWVKDVFVLGHSDYHYRHEDVLYGWKPGPGRVGRGKHAGSRWYGDHAQDSVFEIERPRRSTEHPTMKPVGLVAAQLENSTKRGDVVYDPFAGSGSTLMACENLARRCYAIDVDPRYCDVVVDRWQRHTGRQAERL